MSQETPKCHNCKEELTLITRVHEEFMMLDHKGFRIRYTTDIPAEEHERVSDNVTLLCTKCMTPLNQDERAFYYKNLTVLKQLKVKQ